MGPSLFNEANKAERAFFLPHRLQNIKRLWFILSDQAVSMNLIHEFHNSFGYLQM